MINDRKAREAKQFAEGSGAPKLYGRYGLYGLYGRNGH